MNTRQIHIFIDFSSCRTISCSEIIQNAWINIVVHWKFWRKYPSVSFSFSSKLHTFILHININSFSAFIKLLNTRYLLFLAMCFGKGEFRPFFFRHKPGNFSDDFLITRFSSNFFRQEFNQFGISWKKIHNIQFVKYWNIDWRKKRYEKN